MQFIGGYIRRKKHNDNFQFYLDFRIKKYKAIKSFPKIKRYFFMVSLHVCIEIIFLFNPDDGYPHPSLVQV